jgi:hypothetical protein
MILSEIVEFLESWHFPNCMGATEGESMYALYVPEVWHPLFHIQGLLLDRFLKHIFIVTHICSCERSQLTAESFQNLQ